MSEQEKPNKHSSKSRATRLKIIEAAIVCLDERGYSEASINRIQLQAGVSRGALTHHFPTKQVLVTETAELLLGGALKTFERHKAEPEHAFPLLLQAWMKMFNTREGRALLEILVACRTDRALADILSERLQQWDLAYSEAFAARYTDSDQSGDDAALLWSICRSFVRGLLLHQHFVRDPQELLVMLERFAGMIEAELSKK